MFFTNLQSPVWSRNVGPPIWRPENSVDIWNFGYPGDWLSELNQQTFAQVLFLTLIARLLGWNDANVDPLMPLKCFPPRDSLVLMTSRENDLQYVLQAEYTCPLFFLAVLSQVTAQNLRINLKFNAALLNEPENQAI